MIDHNSVLCLKHFDHVDVAMFNNNNNVGEIKKNGLPLVKEGACPTYFPNDMEKRMSELQVSLSS